MGIYNILKCTDETVLEKSIFDITNVLIFVSAIEAFSCVFLAIKTSVLSFTIRLCDQGFEVFQRSGVAFGGLLRCF